MAVAADEEFFVVVDGRDKSEGSYLLDLQLRAAECGDGQVNPGEQCDFGDTAPGDGCDPSCAFEPPADDSDECPGEVATLKTGKPFLLTDAFTVGYADDYRSRCSSLDGAPDRVAGSMRCGSCRSWRAR